MNIFIVLYIIIFPFILLLTESNLNASHKYKTNCGNIAHACGIISSTKYTNSFEAFNNSYYMGYRRIEIDILVTNDGHIVGAHDWNLFKKITQFRKYDIINYNYISKSKILNKYHIIYDDMIYKLLNNYKNVNIFTDKIINYSLLKQYSKIINRLYVEVFTYEQYFLSKKLGFNKVMLAIFADDDMRKLDYFISNNGSIYAITISPYIFYKYKSKLLHLFKMNILIFSYNIDNVSDIKSAYCNYVSGFYIDTQIIN